MIMQAFSVHDIAVGAFLPVFFARSKGEAIRSFAAAVNDAGHQFAKSKGDYNLFFLGGFDDNSGMLIPSELGPERVIGAIECVTSE